MPVDKSQDRVRRMLVEMAPKYGRVPIVATDVCREMLDIGRAKKAKAGIDGS